jgi:hypothetical protein
MIKGTTKHEVRFKDGHTIRKGETLMIQWPDPRTNPAQVDVLHRDRQLRISAVTALRWIGKSFSEEELAEAVMDSICKTPNGTTVEPDGIDPEGVPSWLLIHGLI